MVDTKREYDLDEELTKPFKWDCKTCYHFDKRDSTCDMCAYGHPIAIDNNGLKPEEVKDCNAYVIDRGEKCKI